MSLLDGLALLWSRTPSVETVARRLIARLAREGVVATYHAASFTVTIPDPRGRTHTLHVSNLHRDYTGAARRDRDQIIEAWFSNAMAPLRMPATFDAARPMLLPVVRSGLYFDQIGLAAELRGDAEAPPPVVSQPVDELLSIAIAVDAPTSMTIVSAQQLTDWRTGWDELHASALANLRQRSSESFEVPHRGLFVAPWHDSHDSSRLLLPDLLDRLAISGRPIALVPNRDTLIVTGDRDVAGLLAAAALAEKAFEQARPIDLAARRWDGSVWSLCIPDASPEVARRYQTMRTQSVGQIYEYQRTLLEAAAVKRGEDLFAATFMVIEFDGETVGITALTRGQATLLPRVDRLAFVDTARPDGENVLLTVPWALAFDVLGVRWKPLGLSPERWRVEVDGFPTAKELKALRAAAPPP